MWTGVLHHVINEHEWVLPHGDENSYKCTHADLGEDQRDKEWLHRSKNASTLKDLASIIMEKRLLNNVSYYLNFRYVLRYLQIQFLEIILYIPFDSY